MFPYSFSLGMIVDPRSWEAPAGWHTPGAGQKNLSEEAVGENAAGACLSAQGSVGSQAAPSLKGQGVQEGTEGMWRRRCQLSVWAAEPSEAQAGVQAS